MKTWAQSHKSSIIIAICIAFFLRFSLFLLPTLSNTLQYRFDLSTPLTSYPRLQNCLFTSEHFVNDDPMKQLTPYASDACTIPVPIILLGQFIRKNIQFLSTKTTFFDSISDKIEIEKMIFFALILICDIVAALCLSGLVYFYQYFQVPVPHTIKAYNIIKSSSTGIAAEVVDALNNIDDKKNDTKNDKKNDTKNDAKNDSKNGSKNKDTKTIINDNVEQQHDHQQQLTVCTTTNKPLDGHYHISTINYDSLSAIIFYTYLFNPITILSSMALNTTHITISLFLIELYNIAIPRGNNNSSNNNNNNNNSFSFSFINIFNIIINGFIHGVLLIIDPAFIYTTLPMIVFIVFRTKTDIIMTKMDNNNKVTKNQDENKKQNINQLSKKSIFVQYTSTLITYITPIIMVYITAVCIQHIWSNTFNYYYNIIITMIEEIIINGKINLIQNFSNLINFLLTEPLSILSSTIISYISPFYLHTYTIHFNFIKTRPTIGTMWYFFIQMFTRFRHFYVILFPLPLFVHSFALTTRLSRYPFFIVSMIMTISYTILHPTPTLQHYTFAIILLIIQYPLFSSYIGNLIFIIFAMIHFIVGCATMWYSWIDLGSGNANFVFFQSILFNLFLMFLLIEIIAAVRSIDAVPPGYGPDLYNPVIGDELMNNVKKHTAATTTTTAATTTKESLSIQQQKQQVEEKKK